MFNKTKKLIESYLIAQNRKTNLLIYKCLLKLIIKHVK